MTALSLTKSLAPFSGMFLAASVGVITQRSGQPSGSVSSLRDFRVLYIEVESWQLGTFEHNHFEVEKYLVKS